MSDDHIPQDQASLEQPLQPHLGDTPEEAARRAAAAKQRFFAVGLFRLSGVFILMFGIAISMRVFGWVQGDKAKWLGLIVSVVGMFQYLIVPKMLLSAWATPRAPRKP